MARVQYHILPADFAVVGGVRVPHYKAVIRERPGAGYTARLRIKKLREAVRLHGSQRAAAEALGISRDQLQRRLRKATYFARPADGEVDYASLRKDVMKRFPKTLKYLQK